MYEPEDVDALYQLLGDAQTMRHWPQPFTREQVADWIARNLNGYQTNGIGRLAVIEKSTGQLVGDCGLIRGTYAGEECWDLGIIIHYAREANGYALQAIKTVVAYVFEQLKLDAIRVNTAVDNKVVRFMAERFGMKRLCSFINERNRNKEHILYEMTRADWLARAKK
jgi:RimJ/RimL family protein N-acetyltransferase